MRNPPRSEGKPISVLFAVAAMRMVGDSSQPVDVLGGILLAAGTFLVLPVLLKLAAEIVGAPHAARGPSGIAIGLGIAKGAQIAAGGAAGGPVGAVATGARSVPSSNGNGSAGAVALSKPATGARTEA